MVLKDKTIAVTGASGMIGVYICRALRKHGAQVIGVVRNPEKAAFLKKEGIEFRKADLNDAASLEKAFAGCDAVVSNAALYRLTNLDWDANYEANKTGTENVFSAMHKNGIKRAVQISTIGLYKFTLAYEINETSAQYGIGLTTLRPSGVYGARDENIMPYFKLAMKLPFLPLPAIGWPLVYAGDVADAVVAALESDNSIGQAYNTSGDERDFADFLSAWHEASGKGARVFKIPLGLGIKISSAKAAHDLGFSNKPFAEALGEIFREEPGLLN